MNAHSPSGAFRKATRHMGTPFCPALSSKFDVFSRDIARKHLPTQKAAHKKYSDITFAKLHLPTAMPIRPPSAFANIDRLPLKAFAFSASSGVDARRYQRPHKECENRAHRRGEPSCDHARTFMGKYAPPDKTAQADAERRPLGTLKVKYAGPHARAKPPHLYSDGFTKG